jgi:hypothetical protein
MSVVSSRPLGVVSLEPQTVCLLLKSPPTVKHEPRVWKKESKWVTFRLYLDLQVNAKIYTTLGRLIATLSFVKRNGISFLHKR